MANVSYRTAGTTQTQESRHAPDACPVCGRLQCLCRPRFFAGQLLTEEDLNRLDHYIIEKNKLHNRYLHGWGVVCGLEVVCNSCPGFVTVRNGYALSPCGEDIVVCREEPVNVCELINQCRDHMRPDWDCDPPQRASDPACQDVMEDWVLAICYSERQSRRPVLTTGAGSSCCSRCACGGSSRCGCGCHGKEQSAGGNKSSLRQSPRSTAPACEPTVVCEGYHFKVYRKPPAPPRFSHAFLPQSELARRVAECESYLTELLTPLPSEASIERLHTWCCEIKDRLVDFFAEHPTHDCTLSERLAAVTCPPAAAFTDPAAYRVALAPVIARIANIAAEYRRYCRCSAQLPPCPDPVGSDCVPLATITIRKRGCQIQRVCNWGVRRFVLNFPLLDYWLGPIGGLDLAALEASCCTPFQPTLVKVPTRQPGFRPASGRVALRMAAAPSPSNVYSSLLSHAWGTRGRVVDEQALALAALGVTDENDQPFATEMELSHSLELHVINQFLRPIVEALLPEELTELIETAATASAAPAEASARPGDGELASLRRTVQELQRTVLSQGEEIRRLGGPRL